MRVGESVVGDVEGMEFCMMVYDGQKMAVFEKEKELESGEELHLK